MLDMFIFETNQLVEQLEQTVLSSEKAEHFDQSINEIFRIMHTIKGNSAMMLFNNISELAHSLEDMFDYLRQTKPQGVDYGRITDIVLEGIDFIKNEMAKIDGGLPSDGNSEELIQKVKQYLGVLKGQVPERAGQDAKSVKIRKTRYYISSDISKIKSKKNSYEAVLYFEEGCGMEDVRAFTVIHTLKEKVSELKHIPEEIMTDKSSIEAIRTGGLRLSFKTGWSAEDAEAHLKSTPFLKELHIEEVAEQVPDKQPAEKKKPRILLDESEEAAAQQPEAKPETPTAPEQNKESSKPDKQAAAAKPEARNTAAAFTGGTGSSAGDIISVNVNKLDKLMDLIGELVISEAMVTRNPEILGLQLDSFHKASRQLRKITAELQDTVMSVRMVSLSATFQKMNRLIRDMSKKIGKEVQLELIGQETEVDKSIIEHIGDPLMHLIRNSVDHGIETVEERIATGKDKAGKITLEAKNAGGDVWIIVRDDGRGLNKEKILRKAIDNGLTRKTEAELTDREIYSFIFLPGFSTKEQVTEFSGRGVGMDVVQKNIEKVRGTIHVDSIPGAGTTISIKIPLTLSIIDGMTIRVGDSRYTIPITSIKESLRLKEEEIIEDLDGNEVIMIRGEGYPVIRLHDLYRVDTEVDKLQQGIIIMAESEGRVVCLFADELVGEQQVVVKALPKYIKKVKGIAGCTILGDGGISLILDIGELIR